MKRTHTIKQGTPLEGTPRNLPTLRADCRNVPRPCPYISCRYHLETEVTCNGNLRLVHPTVGGDGELDFEAPGPGADGTQIPTCALDVADEGGAGLEQIAEWLNVSGERARQIESEALVKLARSRVLQEVAGVRGEHAVPRSHSTIAALAKANRRARIPQATPPEDDSDDV